MSRAKTLWALLLGASLAVAGCKKGEKKDPDAPAEDGGDNAASNGAATTDDGSKPPPPDAPPAGPQVDAPADVAKPPADATKLQDGIVYKVLTEGAKDAKVAGANDLATVHFDVWTRDGKTVHSTQIRKRPDKYPLGGIPMRDMAAVITGMKVGEKRQAWVEADAAFAGRKPKPEALTYRIELVELKAAVAAPKAMKAPADAKSGENGVKYKVEKAGSGKDKARESDQVKVYLDEWSPDGRMRRSTRLRTDDPQQVPMRALPPPVRDMILDMVGGEVRIIWAPKPNETAPDDAARVYRVELAEVVKMPDPPPVPKDVKEPPKGAKKTESGVSYKVLKKGTGKTKPTANSDVTVHYSGWTTDGKMFDSSVTRGRPASFNLSRVIAGWRDGLQVMVEGEKTRFWIPAKLAYEGRSGPQGMLVFDVELIKIGAAKPKVPPPAPPKK